MKKKAMRTELEQLRTEMGQKADASHLKKEADGLRFMLEELTHQVGALEGRCDKIWAAVAENTGKIQALSNALEVLRMPQQRPQAASAIDEAGVRDLQDRLLNVENEVNALKNDYTQWSNML